MTYFKPFIWFILTLSLGYVLDQGFTIGDQRIPGFGKLLNPATGLWKNAEDASKFKSHTFNYQGTDGNIRIYYDDRLVPHIFAESTRDALFAQGYVEAQNRLWQMDFIAREAAGRLSEVVGGKTLRYDIRRRKQGLLYGAELALESWKKDPASMEFLNSYCSGANAYIKTLKSKSNPLEFKLLGYSPTPWTALQSALVLKTMTSTLASYNEDIWATNTLLQLGEENFNKYYQVHDPDQSPVVPDNQIYDFKPVLNRDSLAERSYSGPKLEGLTIFKGIKGVGSNNWALNAQKVAGEFPILCNDPHLDLTLPSIWYEVHIVTPEFNAYGVSIPGMPGIMIGFNDQIAWGNTNVGHDMVDYYTIDWIDEEKRKYRVDGQTKEVEIRTEQINIRGKKDIQLDLKITDFGIVYAEPEKEGLPDIARDWIGYKDHDLKETTVFVNIMRSQDYHDFKKASNEFFTPAQNFLFASKADTVAIRVNGNLPLKPEQDGRFVKKGDSSSNRWQSYIPRKHNPEVFNPSHGFVSSANQVSTSEDYPYYYHGSFEEYRGKRLNEALASMEKADVRDMQDLQLDVYSIRADYFLSLLLDPVVETEFKDEKLEKITALLMNWDCHYDGTSSASKFFEKWISKYRRAFWKNYFKITDTQGLILPEDWVLIKVSNENPDLSHEVVLSTYEATAEDFNTDELETPWMEYRPKSIDHLLDIPSFSYNNINVGGCGDVLNAISSSIGPSWRMIVELDEKTRAMAVYPGGQSGNPASKFYDDSVQKWINGEYNTIDIYKKEDELAEEALYSIKINAGK
ncbi:MAG: penicillin acylase family protein [Saprospiraceae bacterium]|nr:penicillin acylase family protein [Saprospiraceae bacterium]